MDFYKKTITFSYLTALSDNDFLDFFYEFVSVGGLVQSGGDKTKNQFRETILTDLKVSNNLSEPLNGGQRLFRLI